MAAGLDLSNGQEGGYIKAKLPRIMQIDEVSKFMCNYTLNRGTGKLKLLTYELDKLVKWGGIATAGTKGTIFTMDWTLLKIISLQFLIAAFTGFIAWRDEGADAASMDGLHELSKYLSSFVPFVLALYVSLTMQRWWTLRTEALGPVFTCLSNVCLQLSACLPGERYEALRETVLRYGINCVTLMVKAARFEGDDLDFLLKEELFSEEELRTIKDCRPYQRAMVMWSWILRLVYLGWMDAKLPPPSLSPIILQCMKARDGIETVHTYQDTQLPFAYVHLITLLVNINNAVVAVKCGSVAAVLLRSFFRGEGGSTEGWALLNEVMMFFIVPIIYHGLLAISYVIHDPFGEDVLDLPVAAYCGYCFNSCRAEYDATPCPAERKIIIRQEASPPPPARVVPEPVQAPAAEEDAGIEVARRLEQLEFRFQTAVQQQTDVIVEAIGALREVSRTGLDAYASNGDSATPQKWTGLGLCALQANQQNHAEQKICRER